MAGPTAWLLLTVGALALVHFVCKTLIPFIRMARAVNKFPGPEFRFPSGTTWFGRAMAAGPSRP